MIFIDYISPYQRGSITLRVDVDATGTVWVVHVSKC